MAHPFVFLDLLKTLNITPIAECPEYTEMEARAKNQQDWELAGFPAEHARMLVSSLKVGHQGRPTKAQIASIAAQKPTIPSPSTTPAPSSAVDLKGLFDAYGDDEKLKYLQEEEKKNDFVKNYEKPTTTQSTVVMSLPEKVEIVTGEEGEEVLFEHKGKLFIYLPETKETKERGTGPVKILYNPTTKAHRVVMRHDQVHKICANFRLQKNAGMTCGDKPDIRNCCIFRAVDFTDSNEGNNVLFLLRFREDEVYNDFKTQFNNIVGPVAPTESA